MRCRSVLHHGETPMRALLQLRAPQPRAALSTKHNFKLSGQTASYIDQEQNVISVMLYT